MKRCSVCQRTLALTMFSRDRSKLDGLSIRCRECDGARRALYEERNREERKRARAAKLAARPPKSCKTCGAPVENRNHWHCGPCRAARKSHKFRVREATRSRPSAQERGYGWTHQKKRLEMAAVVDSGRALCARCAEPIIPGEPWDLDHFDDRSGYRGPAHRSCNRAAGAAKGNRERRLAQRQVASESW